MLLYQKSKNKTGLSDIERNRWERNTGHFIVRYLTFSVSTWIGIVRLLWAFFYYFPLDYFQRIWNQKVDNSKLLQLPFVALISIW